MVSTASMAEVAALVGEPARAVMLQALMDRRALTATELAHEAGVAPQTASGHLAQLTTAGLVAMTKQGRHRYHRLASPQVARLLETLMLVAAETGAARSRRTVTGPRDAALRTARTCYDHIAGRLGVAMAETMVDRGLIELSDEAGLVTDAGAKFLARLGIAPDAVAPASRLSRPFCRPCLDWSERRTHLAGRLGAALCQHSLDRGWVRKRAASRALDITPAGDRALSELFGFDRRSGDMWVG